MDVDPKQVQESVDFYNALHPPWLPGRAAILLKREVRIGRGLRGSKHRHPKDEAEFLNLIEWLMDANQNRGYAIYLTVNRFIQKKDGTWGTLKTHAIPGRDLMWDDDRGLGLEKVLTNIDDAGYDKPTLIVESSEANYHGHNLCDAAISSMETFVQIQKGFTERAGTCAGVHLPTQKIRIPGPFFNMKPERNKFRVRIVEFNRDKIFTEGDFYKAEGSLVPDITPDEYAMEVEPRFP